jgi:drug/metabolite transporter (DMT)-like permease
MKKFIPEAALLLVTLIWGGTFVIIKNAFEDISAMLFLTIRFGVAALLLLIFFRKVVLKLGKPIIIAGLLLGSVYFISYATQSVGLLFTSATKSAFITGTFVIFTPIFQLIIIKKAPRKGTILGIILVLFGLLLLSGKGDSLTEVFAELGGGFNIGDILTLFCAMAYGLYIVFLDRESKKFDFMPLVFLQILFTAIASFLFTIFFSATGIEEIKFSLSGGVITAVLYTSLLATIITTTLQTKYQKELTPSKAGVILSFEPIFAAVSAYILLGETLTIFGIAGGIFIFGGLLCTELIE